MEHVMTIKAYERKAELGGGYRARVIRKSDKALFESDVLPTSNAARNWAQVKAHQLMNGQYYKRAYVSRRFTGGSYVANIWA